MNYLSNKEFLSELIKYHESTIISKKLHEMFYLLSQRIATKPYIYYKAMNQPIKSEDLSDTTLEFIHNGYLKCLTKIEKFDIDNCKNPFAYFTTVIINTYKDHFFKENRQFILKKISQNQYEHRFLVKWGVPLQKEYEID